MLLTGLKVIGAIFIVLVTLVGCQTFRNSGNTPLPANTADALRIATYNVHYIILGRETGAWSLGDWDRRKTPLDQAFKAVNADVIGFQEWRASGAGVAVM